jgi:hypothetical protein
MERGAGRHARRVPAAQRLAGDVPPTATRDRGGVAASVTGADCDWHDGCSRRGDEL